MWSAYVDLRRDIKVVEVGGIKYGFLDVLTNPQQEDTIASSENGILLFVNGSYYYQNKELKTNIKLNRCGYTKKMDISRHKIFEIDAFTKISVLKEKFGRKDYKMDSNEIWNDYIYFRDNLKETDNYIPSFLMRFYKEIDQVK